MNTVRIFSLLLMAFLRLLGRIKNFRSHPILNRILMFQNLNFQEAWEETRLQSGVKKLHQSKQRHQSIVRKGLRKNAWSKKKEREHAQRGVTKASQAEKALSGLIRGGVAAKTDWEQRGPPLRPSTKLRVEVRHSRDCNEPVTAVKNGTREEKLGVRSCVKKRCRRGAGTKKKCRNERHNEAGTIIVKNSEKKLH
ncbi:hypothetical protein NDU88_003349 [Pleurodeles waltl]|uniref:Uncharacterized protein n=1 Tax=Pleurodeles waltl TaxID=8319 RepID=A0AAV7LIB8_PLEWA|nr:hypothetical protein NDU88_003349 [Pleurodeles waltl]